MRFFYGLLLGFAATGVNFGVLYAVVRRLVREQSGPARYIAPVAQVVRYVLFAAVVYVTLRYRLGSTWGLLAGVTLGIAGFMAWQITNNARHRRSS